MRWVTHEIILWSIQSYKSGKIANMLQKLQEPYMQWSDPTQRSTNISKHLCDTNGIAYYEKNL